MLIAVGAILTWAVVDRSAAVNLDAVGIILMIVGGVGLLLSLLWWERLGFGYWRRAHYVEGPRGRRTIIEEDEPPPPV